MIMKIIFKKTSKIKLFLTWLLEKLKEIELGVLGVFSDFSDNILKIKANNDE